MKRTKDDDSTTILSPPKPKSAMKATRSKNPKPTSVSTGSGTRSSTLFRDMKQEIEELRAQFEDLDRQSRRNHGGVGTGTSTGINGIATKKDSESSFDKDVEVMGQKTNAMADALQRNYVRSDQLQRENDALRREYNKLRTSLDGKRGRGQEEDDVDEDDDDEEEEDEQQQEEEVYFNYENDNSYYGTKARKSPEHLLQDLDPSDDYVKRKYPPVPKTPGTMFTTEIVETLKLEVGEHAYLAEIMDRQWRTSRNYRPL